MTRVRVFRGTKDKLWLGIAKLHDQGHINAQVNLGFSYARGQGIKQDYTQAAIWFLKAAEQGHSGAQANLGVFYHNGWGVPQNDIEAMTWIRKAAAQGNADALKYLKQR